jgi:hypothetical protein
LAHLLYSAKDRDGKAIQGFVEDASNLEARQRLLADGMTEVVLHQDPAIGATDPKQLQGLNAKQLREFARVAIGAMEKPGVATLLRDVVVVNRWWLAFGLALLAIGIVFRSPWLVVFSAALALFPFALALWSFRHGGRYIALVKAFSLGNWAEVERLAAQLRDFSRSMQEMELDIDMRLAALRVRSGGRLEEIVASLEPWRGRLTAQPGMFEQRLAIVHHYAGDRAGFVRLMEAGHALAPQEHSRALDHALAQARYGDATRAAQLLAAADASLLPPFAVPFVHWIDGMAKLRTQQAGGLEQLDAAVAAFLKLASQPATWVSLAFCTCDHAVALSMAGRKEDARRELAEVWPIVRAHADADLLRMLQADGLAPTPNPTT